MGEKRSREKRIYDLVRFVAVHPDAKQTHVMGRCNFNHKSVTKYINMAKESNLISGVKKFRITEDGMRFIEDYRVMNRIY